MAARQRREEIEIQSGFHVAANEIFLLHEAGEFRRALSLVMELPGLYPERGEAILYWQACLLARLEEQKSAIDALLTGMEQGLWWSPEMLKGDPDLDSIRERPEFQQLRFFCEERLAEARVSAKPELVVRRPSSTDPESPLIIVLHWRGRDPVDLPSRWSPAVEAGGVVAFPRSSQQLGMTSFGWDDPEIARREIADAYLTLAATEIFSTSRVVIAGVSQGGHFAIDLALSGDLFSAAGFLAIVPAIRDGTQLLSKLPDAAKRGIRGWLITGEYDFGLDHARLLHQNMTSAGVPNGYDIVPGMGHDIPRDFEQRLPSILDFLIGSTE